MSSTHPGRARESVTFRVGRFSNAVVLLDVGGAHHLLKVSIEQKTEAAQFPLAVVPVLHCVFLPCPWGSGLGLLLQGLGPNGNLYHYFSYIPTFQQHTLGFLSIYNHIINS